MENKEFMKIVNKNHQGAYKSYCKEQKRKNFIGNIIDIAIIGLAIVGLAMLFITMSNDREEAIEHCVSQGNSYNYCSIEASK